MQAANPELDQPELLQRLATDGFVLLPDLCGSTMVQSMLAVSRRIAGEIRDALGDRDIGIGSAAGYVEIVQRSPGRWDVPITPQQFGIDDRQMPWWPLIAGTLGDDAEHSFSGVVSSEPGSPAQHWHIDSPHEAVEHRGPHAINVLVALHDIPLQMGPTECARGSHIFTNHLRNPALVPDELVYQHASTSPELLVQGMGESTLDCHVEGLSSGSCLVFDDRLLHRGLGNQSDSTRHVAYFSYRKQGYAVNTHFESNRSVFQSPG